MPAIYKGMEVFLQFFLDLTMSITATNDKERTVESKPKDQKDITNGAKHKKTHNFTRSQSIEKIIKFNTYICSQNFFLLPAILTWLRTSQTVLKSYSEKCRQFTKSLAFLLLQTIEEHLRIISSSFKNMSFSDPKKSLEAFKELFGQLYSSIPEEMRRKLLEIGVYGAFLLIFLQFVGCALFLAVGAMPGGLIFMLVSISWISYMNYQCLRLIMIKDQLKEEEKCDNSATQKYIRPKDILGKRTISKLNLF